VRSAGAIRAAEWDTVYAERFTIDADGAAYIAIPLEVEQLNVYIAGGVSLALSGNADTADISIAGATNISADNLQTRDARIEIAGAGNVTIAVSDHLDVVINGVGNVRYTGNPTVTRRILGLGTVRGN